MDVQVATQYMLERRVCIPLPAGSIPVVLMVCKEHAKAPITTVVA